MHPRISVIIPCYNSERTVAWAITSALKQSYSDLEVICVDDGSTDATANLVREIAEKDSRVVYIRNEPNRGLGPARNVGLSVAKGEFIAFLDDDDAYEVDFLDVLVEVIEREKADIAQCRLRYIFADRTEVHGSPSGTVEGEQAKFRVDIFDGLPYLTPQSPNKLFRATAIKTKRYEAIAYEDAEFIVRVLADCSKFVCVSEPLYNYHKVHSRITGTNARNLRDIDFYLSSLASAVRPYFEPRFTSLLTKWGAPLPGSAWANVSNYLRALDQALATASSSDRGAAAHSLRRFEQEILERVGPEQCGNFFSLIHKLRNLPGEAGALQYVVLKPKPIWSRVVGYLTNFAERSLGIWDRLVPKSKSTWAFVSWSHYPEHTLDNPRAVFERVKRRQDIKKVVLQNASAPEDARNLAGENARIVPLRSLKGLWGLARASRIFTGYSLHDAFGYRRIGHKRREIVQLWHGIPLKKIGLEVQRIEKFWPNEAPRYAAVVSSSQSDASTMAKSFSPDAPSRVKVTGLPRHDFLTMPEGNLPADYQGHLATLRRRLGGRRLVLFAPTWRSSRASSALFDPTQLRTLSKILDEHQASLGLRLHRHTLAHGAASFGCLTDRIFTLNDLPDVSVILRETEILITDYSSLYVDFMLLSRPVLLYTPDIREYERRRGFNYEFDEFRPHEEKATSFEDLSRMLELSLQDQRLDKQYETVLRTFHEYPPDGRASQRVLESLANPSQG